MANGDEVAADVVIHNGGTRGLINLVGRENLPPDYVERIEGLVPLDCVAIILGTTEPLWEGVPMLMTPGTDRVFGVFAPTFFDPSVAPPERQMIDVFLPLLSQDRGAELELALADLRALFPHLDEVTEMMVPMFFLGNWPGAGCAQTFGQVGKECDLLIRQLLRERDSIPTDEAVAYSLLARHLKRIGAHLANIATAVVAPVHRIDYVDEPQAPEEP